MSAIIICNSCSKPGIPNVPVDSAMKKAFSFKPGSYWIYRDSISGNFDSCFVSAYVTPNLTTYNGEKTFDLAFMFMYHYQFNNTNIDTMVWHLVLVANRICLEDQINLGTRLGTFSINYYPLINYPFNTKITNSGISEFTGYGGKTSIELLDNYNVKSNIYSNVGVNNDSASSFVPVLPSHDSSIWFSYNNSFYLCPNIGFIKIVINQPFDSTFRNWELIRYKIVN